MRVCSDAICDKNLSGSFWPFCRLKDTVTVKSIYVDLHNIDLKASGATGLVGVHMPVAMLPPAHALA